MEQPDRRTMEWSQILMPLTPQGVLPRAGTPSRLVADFAADSFREHRLFEPSVVKPEFIAGESGATLLRIADAARPGARDLGYRSDVRCNPEAKRLLEEAGVRDYVGGLLGRPVAEKWDAFFLYYTEGGHTPLHVDNAEYSPFNLLSCLRRVRREGEGRQSVTYFMESADQVNAYDLDPGQAIWFHSSETPHGRTPLTAGEEVVLLAVSLLPGD
jgi:hypothetical protein